MLYTASTRIHVHTTHYIYIYSQRQSPPHVCHRRCRPVCTSIRSVPCRLSRPSFVCCVHRRQRPNGPNGVAVLTRTAHSIHTRHSHKHTYIRTYIHTNTLGAHTDVVDFFRGFALHASKHAVHETTAHGVVRVFRRSPALLLLLILFCWWCCCCG